MKACLPHKKNVRSLAITAKALAEKRLKPVGYDAQSRSLEYDKSATLHAFLSPPYKQYASGKILAKICNITATSFSFETLKNITHLVKKCYDNRAFLLFIYPNEDLFYYVKRNR